MKMKIIKIKKTKKKKVNHKSKKSKKITSQLSDTIHKKHQNYNLTKRGKSKISQTKFTRVKTEN